MKWNGFDWEEGDCQRRGGWISTYTGRRFWPMDPRADEIDPRDIAHALSLQCRFSGMCNSFFSVAEHSIRVADVVKANGADATTELWALLHDASEAYLMDMPRPLKHTPGFASGYLAAEIKLMKVIAERFGLDWSKYPHEVEVADQVLLATERRDLMGAECKWEVPGVEPLEAIIRPRLSQSFVEQTFLERLYVLTGRIVSEGGSYVGGTHPHAGPPPVERVLGGSGKGASAACGVGHNVDL
jgi:hypothetical protein